MAVLFLRQLIVPASIGVLPSERQQLQELVIDVECVVDAWQASQADHIQETVDYASLKDCVVQCIAMQHYVLVETLAVRLVSTIHQTFQVQRCQVTVGKPAAFSDVALAGVTVDTSELKGDRYGRCARVVGTAKGID